MKASCDVYTSWKILTIMKQIQKNTAKALLANLHLTNSLNWVKLNILRKNLTEAHDSTC